MLGLFERTMEKEKFDIISETREAKFHRFRNKVKRNEKKRCLVSVSCLFSIELKPAKKIHQSLKTVFDHISKLHEVRRKYCAARHILNSLLGA